MIGPEDNLIDYVDDYVHGLLNERDAALVGRFCETSKLGQAALDDARQRYALFHSLPATVASEELIQRTLDSVADFAQRDAKWSSIYRQSVGVLAIAATIIIGVMTAYYWNLSSSSLDLRLLGQSTWLPDSQVSVRVAAWDMKTSAPHPGLNVSFHLVNPRTKSRVDLATGVTDDNGVLSPCFQTPDWEDGSYELQVEAELPGKSEVLSRVVKLKRDWRVLLTTDKPVYQPGQTVHVRSLSLKKPSLNPVSGQDIHFSIQDPKGNWIFKRREVTSRFGISAVDCPLAREVAEGDYRVICEVGGTKSETTIRVQKYTLPKFKIDLAVDQSYYRPGQTVKAQLKATYFFGEPVVGGKVLVAVRSTGFGEQPIREIEAETDANGDCELTFELPERVFGTESDHGNAQFQVAATVVDSAGQQHSTGLRRIVAVHPIQVLLIPEGGQLSSGLTNRIFVVTHYADGQPAFCRVVISGYEQELQTNAAGVAVLELPPSFTHNSVLARATDAEGRSGRAERRLDRTTKDGDFLLRPDRAIYSGGQTMTLEVMASGSEPVFIDLLKDGQSLGSHSVDITSGYGEVEIDLPTELAGTVQIVAFRASTGGYPIRRSRTILVEPAKQLQIQATMDREQFRPGEQARIQFQLRDETGAPKAGALSLHAVDEAVYAVLGQRTNLQQAFFMLEEQSLQPIFERYPNWSPSLRQDIPVNEQAVWQQAMFSLTATVESYGFATISGFLSKRSSSNGEEPMDRTSSSTNQDSANPYNLFGETYSRNRLALQLTRDTALARLAVAWCALFVGLFLISKPRAFVNLMFGLSAVLMVLFLVFAVALLLFALGCGAAVPPPKSSHEFADRDADMTTSREQQTPESAAPRTAASAPATPRVREWFPETLLWRPELITDENGVATLQFDLADSITTWRVTSTAVTGDGRLGAREFPIRVFQSFFVDLNLPNSLTRGDQVNIPVVLYNYLDSKQTVTLSAARGTWFEAIGQDSSTSDDHAWMVEIELLPGQVRSIELPIRALQAGSHVLEIKAIGETESDAFQKHLSVLPEGLPQEETFNGAVNAGTTEWTIEVPESATKQSGSAILKLYPSKFSQMLEGLNGIFQLPSGCFEQTSSTTYPNVLALKYLRRTGQSRPDVELKARQYIHLGYQRLLTFESRSGGFEWFGKDPGDIRLTAYGLMQFQDMAQVHEVDPKVIERTRHWLLDKQLADGSWPVDTRMSALPNDSKVETTAYVATAVFLNNSSNPTQASRTLDYLLSRSRTDSPYTLAMLIHAIVAIEPNHAQLPRLREQLAGLQQRSSDGTSGWWNRAENYRTLFYGSGRSGTIETTALAALALEPSPDHRACVEQALVWLSKQRDGRGTWHSTQATILALKALTPMNAGPVPAFVGEQDCTLKVWFDDQVVRQWQLGQDQRDVMQIIPLGQDLEAGKSYRVRLESDGRMPLQYQLALRHYSSSEKAAENRTSPFEFDIQYDRQTLAVNDTIRATATISQDGATPVPMVMVDLPIPPGFEVETDELQNMVFQGTIEKFELKPGQVLVYLRVLRQKTPIELRYQLRATMPLEVSVTGGTVYEYYDPANRSSGASIKLEVK
ncbi:MAG: hypothetical protein JNL67_18015 [Planctomycetaceae bacterium]|nr:hypothetical protein [Planctomycetaceae bacterium]